MENLKTINEIINNIKEELKMPRIIKDTNERTLIPPGNYPAICTEIYDLGTQNDDKFNKAQFKMWIGFELHDGEKIYNIGKEYSVSFGEKSNLRRDLEAWRNKPFNSEELKGFDLMNLLDKCCLINVIHKVSQKNGSTYSMIGNITGLPKGLQKPIRQGEIKHLFYDEWTDDKINALPGFLQNKIKNSSEYISKAYQFEMESLEPLEQLERFEEEVDDEFNDDIGF